MTTKEKYVPIAIRICISFLFLLSAVAKLYPSPYFAISTFEVKQLYPLGFSGDVAPFFSRILMASGFFDSKVQFSSLSKLFSRR